MFKQTRHVSPVIRVPGGVSKPSREVLEARQEAQILTTYALSPYLRANDFKVTVCQGTATLSGSVSEDVSKALAREIALGVDGITSVDDQIEVIATYNAPERSADRSFGEMVDDVTINAAVKSKLMWSRHADGFAAKVETLRGKVILSGTASSAEAREAAGMLAGNTRGVTSVDNQMLVEAAKPNGLQPEASDIADSWITLKVKSTLLYSSNVESSEIAVSTNDGIVTLAGKTDSGAKRALAIELANNVRGVKSVDSTALTANPPL